MTYNTPELFLNAARSGASVGSDIASRRQQAAMATAQMAQQANLSTLQAAQEQNSLLLRAAAARQEQEANNALNMEKLRIGTQESALDRALRQREIEARLSAVQAENIPLELRALNDPQTGQKVGYGFGRTARWLPEEIPATGTPMLDQSGNVVANRFGQRVVNVPREKSYSRDELDFYTENPELDPRRARLGVSASTNAIQGAAFGPIPASSGEVIPLPSNEKVMVVSPSGKMGTIPKSNLENALKNGYKLSQ